MPHVIPFVTGWAAGGKVAEDVTGVDAGINKTLGLGTEMPEMPAVPTPPNPADENAQAQEEARQAELDKRRRRVKTLLTSQEETGMANVGKKVLLGG